MRHLPLVLLLLAGLALPAWADDTAGVSLTALTRAQLARLLPGGLSLGPRDSKIPAFPILRRGEIVGYVFSTGAIAPMPGFSGTPIDLSVAIDRKGDIIDVQILNQKEPMFTEWLGDGPFLTFLKQYRGQSIRRNITVGSDPEGRTAKGDVVLDGISRATVSVRIANLTILASARAVAGLRLDGGAEPAALARVRPDDGGKILPWNALIERRLVGHLLLTNGTVNEAFARTHLANAEAAPQSDPQGRFIDLYFALASVPQIGRSLIGEAGYRELMRRLGPAGHALLVLADGRPSLAADGGAGGPPPLRLEQFDASLALTDITTDLGLTSRLAHFAQARMLALDDPAGFDPGSPFNLVLRVVRRGGAILPETAAREFVATYALPEGLIERRGPEAGPRGGWADIWWSRRTDLALTSLLLAALALGLCFQRTLTRRPQWFARARIGSLALTLGFIGWYAQGQLSIVTLMGVLRAAGHNLDLGFLLFDPVSLLIWGFVIISLFIWGRGTFCGWLCPFGALQELADRLGHLLGLPQWRLPPAWDRRLERIKYGVLLVLAITAVLDAGAADTFAEVEPFKTAITLGFVRQWPFLTYAGLLLLGAMVTFKPYCRFLCPLGAALAVGGRVRLVDWIPRRRECGTPCKLCSHRCRYNAIEPAGAIRYGECFQCLDCVGIYHDARQCVPLVLEADARKRPLRDRRRMEAA
jgi:transcriptional regulator of nitric oxide reductase